MIIPPSPHGPPHPPNFHCAGICKNKKLIRFSLEVLYHLQSIRKFSNYTNLYFFINSRSFSFSFSLFSFEHVVFTIEIPESVRGTRFRFLGYISKPVYLLSGKFGEPLLGKCSWIRSKKWSLKK